MSFKERTEKGKTGMRASRFVLADCIFLITGINFSLREISFTLHTKDSCDYLWVKQNRVEAWTLEFSFLAGFLHF